MGLLFTLFVHPVRRMGLSVLLIACCWSAQPVLAQRVEAYVSADSVAIGDRFTLTLLALHGAEVAPVFPDPADSLFGDLEVLGIETLGGQVLPSGHNRLDSIVYEVTTFALDTALVPPLPVVFPMALDTVVAASSPLMVPVASLVPEGAEDINDLAELAEFSRPVWPYVLLGQAFVIIVGLVWHFLRERKRAPAPVLPPPPPQVSPYDAARERLRTLESTARLDVPAQIKPFYVELSDILRTYLEQRIGVPALECTTRELMQELDQATVRHTMPGGAPQQIRSILDLADLVKFADFKPVDTQGRTTLADTRKTVDIIEAKLRQIAMDQERMTPRIPADPPAVEA